jgi:iron complex outermembrane receptor protein
MLAYAAPTPQLRAATLMPSAWVVNGRIALADLKLGGKKAEIALWGRNLADNKRFTELDQGVFMYYGRYQRARTYGVDVTFEF